MSEKFPDQPSSDNEDILRSDSEKAIPPQYKGLPSEVLKELMQPPIYADEAKNQEVAARVKDAVMEAERIEGTTNMLATNANKFAFETLSPEESNFLPAARNDALQIIDSMINSDIHLKTDAPFDPNEIVALTKLKERNPEKLDKILTKADAKVLTNIVDNIALKMNLLAASCEVSQEAEGMEPQQAAGNSTTS